MTVTARGAAIRAPRNEWPLPAQTNDSSVQFTG